MGALERREIARWRMRTLRLVGEPFTGIQDAVRWLGAVQSQDYGPAKWSIGYRTTGIADADVDRALADGTILRTHVLRSTWHFVLPEDIRWLLELTAPRIRQAQAYYARRREVDDAVMAHCKALLERALQGGRQLTRKQVEAVLAEGGITGSGERLGHILMNAELDGLICSGALQGTQQTYALLDERVPPTRRLTLDEALAALTLRYFTSHGPATLRDFSWWASLTITDIKRGLEMVREKLQREAIEGVTYWFAEPPAVTLTPSPSVHLLQGYDEYTVGYSESKYVLDVSGKARSTILDRGSYVGVLTLDGQVAGHWKRTTAKRSLLIDVALYEVFDEARSHALQATADRMGAFLGLPTTVLTTLL